MCWCHSSVTVPPRADHWTLKWTEPGEIAVKFPWEVDRTLWFPSYQNGSLLILRDVRKPPMVEAVQHASSTEQKPCISKIHRFSTGSHRENLSQCHTPRILTTYLRHVCVLSSYPVQGPPVSSFERRGHRFEHRINFYINISRQISLLSHCLYTLRCLKFIHGTGHIYKLSSYCAQARCGSTTNTNLLKLFIKIIAGCSMNNTQHTNIHCGQNL
jgi:hypothetical protein